MGPVVSTGPDYHCRFPRIAGGRLNTCQTTLLLLSAVNWVGQHRAGDRFLLKHRSRLQLSAGRVEAVILVAERGHPGSCWMGGRFQLLIRESSIYLSPAPCLVNFFAVFQGPETRRNARMPGATGISTDPVGHRL
jgi:hypothetical protein